MQINVTDIHASHSVGTYGYCTCGREVRYGIDKELSGLHKINQL